MQLEFESRWKEELVVSGPGGSFVLEHPMGVPTVYLPTELEWRKRAPDWALGLWSELRSQLESWCSKNDIQLQIEDTAEVYPA